MIAAASSAYSERFISISYFVSLTEKKGKEKQQTSPVPRPLTVRHVSPPKDTGRRDSSADSDYIPNTPAKRTPLSQSLRSMPARSQKDMGKCVGKIRDSSDSGSDNDDEEEEEQDEQNSDLDGVQPLE